MDSTHRRLVVSERLTHTHKHNIGNAQRTGIFATSLGFLKALHLLQVAGTGHHLLHNFSGGKVTRQALLSGGAEGAVHAASCL